MRRPSLNGLAVKLSLQVNSALTAPHLIPSAIENPFSVANPFHLLFFTFRCIPSIRKLHHRNRCRRIVQLSFMILAWHLSPAQGMKETVDTYFEHIRSGIYPSIPPPCTDPGRAESTLELLRPYLSDSIPVIRTKAYELTHLAASGSSDNEILRKGVETLMNACTDPHPGNVDMALSYLIQYERYDYTSAARDTLKNFIRRHTTHLDQLLKLAGFLNLTGLKKEIYAYTTQGNPPKIRWAAILSLARMGDPDAVEEMLSRVSKLGVNDEVVYQVFPDLIYSRQRKAIESLLKALRSDDKKCMSADAERETPIVCGYRIMEQLAPVIKDYPLQLDESGDINTPEYAVALKTVRQWFEANNNFTILNDQY